MFNKLYIVHREDNGNNIYWTLIGNDSQRSKDYRKQAQLKYCNAEFTDLIEFTFKDDKETKETQLLINELLKPWTNKNNYKSMQICIKKSVNEFTELVKEIVDNRMDSDRINEITERLIEEYENISFYKIGRIKLYESCEQGYIYLIKCANNKLKIGKTNDLRRRFEELKNSPKVMAIEIIDKFNTRCMSKDEAKLHSLCHKYKCNANEDIKYLQSIGNSELFDDCKEVIDIWNKYKVYKEVDNN